MASDEERNKGIKRKSEESAEESANKHLRPDDGGSSETKQVEQAEENVRESIPIIYCIPNELGTDPQCTVCKTSYPIYIDSSPFKDHCKKKHPDIDTEKNKSEWIFRYFDLVENTQHLRCKICKGTVEVLEFKGQFIDHFFKDEEHKQYVEIMLEGDNEDTEEVKKCRTIDVVRHLYKVFKKKDTIEDNENKEKCEKSKEGISSEKQDEQVYDARYKAWWMNHVKWIEDNQFFCNVTDCPQNMEIFKVYFGHTNFESHIKSHQPEVQLVRNKHITDYLFADNFLVRCNRCNKPVSYTFVTKFTKHFKDTHIRYTAPKRVGESSQKTNNDENTNGRIIALLQYLTENHKLKIIMSKAKKPTQAVKINADMDT